MTAPVTTEAMIEALTKINGIRNSIIGLQTMNWSEHIYPLVAALNAAGFEGMSYPEARENFGTMLERTNAAEAALATANAELARLRAGVEAVLVEVTLMATLLLMAGEMTAQERRTARAIAEGIAAKILTALARAATAREGA